jgi:hypothetical protein
MPHTEVPQIPVFVRWFGSWQVRIERLPLTPEALAGGLAERSGPRRHQARRAPRGLFRMTSLTAIGHNASAGTAGKESKT